MKIILLIALLVAGFTVAADLDKTDSSKTELGGRKSQTTGTDGDVLSGLMGENAGASIKTKGVLKAPTARDIDMGSGDGARSRQEILQVVNARMPALKNIYSKHLDKKPDFSGKVTVKFTVAPDGNIISIAVVSSTTGYQEFDEAVKNIIATWKWKEIKSGNTTPTIPFNFTTE